MELKRIIARDTQAANEKAVALYGPDVLVISTSKVKGKTELIVAVDVEPLAAEAAVAEAFVPTEKTYSLSTKTASQEAPVEAAEPAPFGKVLNDTMAMHKRLGKPAKAPATGFVPAASLKKSVQEQTALVKEEQAPLVQPEVLPAQQMAEERDTLRGR
jgi:flagellar biosynthesis GTPase FlhF